MVFFTGWVYVGSVKLRHDISQRTSAQRKISANWNVENRITHLLNYQCPEISQKFGMIHRKPQAWRKLRRFSGSRWQTYKAKECIYKNTESPAYLCWRFSQNVNFLHPYADFDANLDGSFWNSYRYSKILKKSHLSLFKTLAVHWSTDFDRCIPTTKIHKRSKQRKGPTKPTKSVKRMVYHNLAVLLGLCFMSLLLNHISSMYDGSGGSECPAIK